MRSGRPPRGLLVALLVLAVAAWAVLMRFAFATLYVEPTDAAIARAAAARPGGIVGAISLLALAAALAAVSRRRVLGVVGLPGLVAGGWLLLAPSSHGAAFVYGLVGSVIALVVMAVDASRRAGAPRR